MRSAEANLSEAAPLEAPGRPRTVVVGVDGSACADRALARAAALIDDDGLLVLVAVDPETEIAREQRADLLVVGRRGRDFAARVLLGSVASRLTADAPRDVLVVR